MSSTARCAVTVAPVSALRRTTEDDGGAARMEAEAAGRTVAP